MSQPKSVHQGGRQVALWDLDKELSSLLEEEDDDDDEAQVPAVPVLGLGAPGVGLDLHGQEDMDEAGPSSSPVFGPEESAPPPYEYSEVEYSFTYAGPGMPYSPSAPPYPSDSEMEGDDPGFGPMSEANEGLCTCAYCVPEKEEEAPPMEWPVEEESGCPSTEPGTPSSIYFSAVEDMEPLAFLNRQHPFHLFHPFHHGVHGWIREAIEWCPLL
ncbi:hypothetical protein ABVT39_004598 [Epinephelus coioides]